MAAKTETENPTLSLQDKGFVNIGSHPSNDVVITDEGVQPFHALLDCRQEPYTLAPLSRDGEITLNGMQLPDHRVFQMSDNDTLSLGNHRLRILPAANGMPLRLAIASGQNKAEDIDALPGLVDANLPGTAQDDFILASLDKTAAEICVDQTAIFVLSLGNGSPIVSTFHVQVDGIPDDWVLVSPANVNLNEGAHGMVTVEITPPRRPTSSAGVHPFRFTITSHNHPDRRVTLQASLTIQPYYDFGISELTPQRRKIGWGQKTGLVTMDVTNRGNNNSPFLMSAQDEENGCRFQFVDNNNLKQSGQVQYTIPAGETHTTELHISPVKRSLIRMRSQSFSYRVVTAQPENQNLTLFTTGTAISAPLINALGVFLILALLIGITGYLFTPRIDYFKADNNLIGVGESTTLRWKTSPFTHNVSITGVEKSISGSQGAQQVFPASTVSTYTFTASTWLWSLLGLTSPEVPVTVMAVPGEPVISTFTVSSQEALVGDEVTLRWSVDNVEKLLLTINGVTDTFEESADFNGERKLVIEKPTLISLEAQNSSGTVVASKFIEVSQPSIVIDRFELSKSTITTGDQVTIYWKVSGVGMENGGEVTISAFDSVLPLEGQMTFFPKESMEFVLTARNRKLQESRILPVGVLEPGTPPAAPTIDFFTAAPDTLVGEGKVELAWSVSGAFDSIQISNGSKVVASGLSAQGFRTITVSESGTYVLTATYQDKSAGANLKITVNPALIKPNLIITSVYPEVNLEMGDTSLVSVEISNPNSSDAPPTGKIVVTDGTSSCVIELPKTNCNLTFETPGQKSITASYQGDSLHVQTVSDPYPTAITVLGNTITLTASAIPTNSIYYFNQKITLRVVVNGTNPSRVPDGEIRVRRMCDGSGDATYVTSCTNEVIGYHKLTAADSGSYKFTDLTIDQVGGTWKLQIVFAGDSFYNPADQEANLTIDGSSSPVSIGLATSSNLPGLSNHAIPYTVTVTDDNVAGIYFVPAGTVSLKAVHSDGVTELLCSNVTLVSNGDGRSSKAACSITPTKSGVWSLSVTYTVDKNSDIIHVDTDQTFPDLTVNSNVQATITSAPAEAMYSTNGTADLDLVRAEDTTVAVADGTLACSFPAGVTDGACSCLHVAGSVWRCTFRPIPLDTLPVNKIITFTYTPSSTSFLNARTLTHTLSVEKASTTASISASPDSTYQIGDVYGFQISAAHAVSGGTAPTSGKVTAILGTGTCSATQGMTSGVLSTSTVDLGTSQSFTFESNHRGRTMIVCYRYEGDSTHYLASDYSATSTFTVTSQATSVSIATQPNSTVPYLVGGSYAITVNAVRTSDNSAITVGNVSIQLGTGQCNANNGMTSGLISNWSNTVGAAQNVEFTIDHVTGQDLRFCVRYDGNGTTLAASQWLASNTLRVKAVPTWNATTSLQVDASETKDVTVDIAVVLRNAYQPESSHVRILLNDETGTIVCPSPATDTTRACSLASTDTSVAGQVTYHFSFGTSTAGTITVRPAYVASLSTTDVDSNNTDAMGTTFTIQSIYNLSIGSVSTTAGCSTCATNLWAYTDKEQAANNIMSTDLMTYLTVAHFTNFDFTTAGINASVTGEHDSTTGLSVSGSCTITNVDTSGGVVGRVDCPQIRITDSVIDLFRVSLNTPNNALYSSNLSSTTESGLRIVQNIVENNSAEPAYIPKIDNGGCQGDDGHQQVFLISGYAADTGDPAHPLLSTDFIFTLVCEDNDDGDSDWDHTYIYHSGNSAFTQLVWDESVTPHKFSFEIRGNTTSSGYRGCANDADGVQFNLDINDASKDFELLNWSTGDTYLHDDNGGTTGEAFDHCR